MLLYLSSDESLSEDFVAFCKTIEAKTEKEVIIIKDYSPKYDPAQVTKLISETVCVTYSDLSARSVLPIVIGSAPVEATRTDATFVEHCEANIVVQPSSEITGALKDPQSSLQLGCIDRSEIETLYFFGDVVNSNAQTLKSQQELFEYVCKRLLYNSTEVFRQPVFDDLIKGVDFYVDHVIGKTKDAEDNAKREMDNYRSQLLAAIRKHKDTIKLRGNPLELKDKIVQQFKYVLDMPEVAAASIKDETFRIRLKNPTVIHASDGNSYDIGLLSMYVRLNDGSVVFDNHTRKVGDRNHPHQNGSAMCLGEISEFVPEMIAENELAGLTKILINFSNSVNLADSAGATITQWPKIQ